MSTEENKATIKRLFEEMNKGNLDIIDEVFADDFLRHATDGQTMDRSAYKQIMTMLSGALPDLQSNLEGIVAEGDNVAFHFTWSGTHQGDLMGAPPTGKKIAVSEAYFARFKNGKIAEYISFMDTALLNQQMGGGPPGG